MKTIELYVAYDKAGDYGIGCDEGKACENYSRKWKLEAAVRVLKLTLNVEEPLPVNLSATIPANVGTEVVAMTVGTP